MRQQLPSDRTVFHGRKSGDEYYSVLSGWDFITSVSDYEGLPISMLEAFSAGVLRLCPAIGCGGDEYAAKLGLTDFRLWNAFDFGQAADRDFENEYFRIFDEFVRQIADEPRITQERLTKRVRVDPPAMLPPQ